MKYKFVGDGMGVPGLPHEITDEEAQQLGVEQILAGALANGNYVSVISDQYSVVSDQNPHPSPLPKRERGMKKE